MGFVARFRSESLLVLVVFTAACSSSGIKPRPPDAAQAADAASAADATKDSASSPSPDVSGPDSPVATIDAGLCGNGKLDPGEECDDGNTVSGDGCSSECKIDQPCECNCPGKSPLECTNRRLCGNGVLTSNEECDDGNTVSGDGCTGSCQMEPGWRCRAPGRPCSPICGDGQVVGWETCDDGNTDDGDGCAHNCLVEPCWDCSGGSCVYGSCGDGGQDADEAGEGGALRCGDGILSPGEECDDGEQNSDERYGGCTTRCTFGPFCGDGQVNPPEEQCDLGRANGTVLGKGGCTFGCTTPHYCGDGFVDTDLGEECDLGDLNGVKVDSALARSDAGMVVCDKNCQFGIGVLPR